MVSTSIRKAGKGLVSAFLIIITASLLIGTIALASQSVTYWEGLTDASGNALSFTGGTLPANVSQVAGTAASTAAAGTLLVGVQGHAGANVDAATGAVPPANGLLVAGVKAATGFLQGLAIISPGNATSILQNSLVTSSLPELYNGSTSDLELAGPATATAGAAGTALTQANDAEAFGGIPVTAEVEIDPCASSAVKKLAKQATITTATTTEIVAGVASKVVHVCGVKIENIGTSPSWQLEWGTKTSTACDTTATVWTPPFAGADSAVGTAGNGNTVMGFGGNEIADSQAVASSELCLVSAGTITDIFVLVSYTQQ